LLRNQKMFSTIVLLVTLAWMANSCVLLGDPLDASVALGRGAPTKNNELGITIVARRCEELRVNRIKVVDATGQTVVDKGSPPIWMVGKDDADGSAREFPIVIGSDFGSGFSTTRPLQSELPEDFNLVIDFEGGGRFDFTYARADLEALSPDEVLAYGHATPTASFQSQSC